MSKITAALMNSQKRDTGEVLGACFSMGEPALKCRIARNQLAASASDEPKVNTLCFAIDLFLNQKLQVAAAGSAGPFLMELPGSWKAMVAYTLDTISVTTDCPAEEIGAVNGCALFLWFLNLPEADRSWHLDQSTLFLNTAIRHFHNGARIDFVNACLEFFDAFYYECKASFDSIEIISMINPMETEIAFGRKEAMQPFPLQDDFLDLSPGAVLPPLEGISTAPATENDAEKEAIQKLYEDCRTGKYRIFDCYFPEHQDEIPPLSLLEGFRPTREFAQNFRRVYAAMCDACGLPRPGMDTCLFKDHIRQCRTVLNMAWFGPPGTGKSFLCDILAAAMGLPVFHIGCSSNMEESDFIWSPVADEGGIRMTPSVFWSAYKSGGIVVLDEANLVKPGVLQGVFSKALEKPYELGEKSEHKCTRNPRTIVVLTCNPGTAGTQLQNTAFYNRFRSWTQFEPAEEEETITQIYKMLPELNGRPDKEAKIIRQTLTEFYLIYQDLLNGLTRQMADMADVSTVLSTRSLIGAATDMFLYGDQEIFRNKARRIASRREAAVSSLLSPAICTVQEKSDEDTVAEFMTKVILPIQINLDKDRYPRSRIA